MVIYDIAEKVCEAGRLEQAGIQSTDVPGTSWKTVNRRARNTMEDSQQTCREQAGRQSTDGPVTRWKTVNRRAGNKLQDSQQTGREQAGRQSTDGPGTRLKTDGSGTRLKTVNRRAGNTMEDSQQTAREHDFPLSIQRWEPPDRSHYTVRDKRRADIRKGSSDVSNCPLLAIWPHRGSPKGAGVRGTMIGPLLG